MSNPSPHRARRSYRRLIAIFLTTIYLTIAMSPLATLAMHSKVVAHAVTGECSGDCDICGCSLESRMDHTCCCAKKRQVQADAATLSAGNRTPQAATAPGAAKGSCYAALKPTEPLVAKNDRCSITGQHPHDEKAQEPAQEAATTKTETVYKCGCPCNDGKLPALTGFGSNELLPNNACDTIAMPHVETLYADLSHRLTSRYGEPPDPPPKLSICS